jgi:APA family basic amino acid/polyamine antiporter
LNTSSQVNIRALFAVIYATSVSAIYFALGVVAHHADGLTPVVFVVSGLFFLLTGMTYAEAASLHPGRGGAAVFARHAFNELVSFIAGWAIALDYTILIAVAALTAPAYLSVFWHPLGHGLGQLLAALVVIALVTVDAVRGVSASRLRRRVLVAGADLAVQALVIVLGGILLLHPANLTHSIHLGSHPSWKGLGFALPVGVVACAGLESASGLAAEVRATPAQLRRLINWSAFAIVLVYVGISIIGIGALPVHGGVPELGARHLNAPVLGIVEAFRPKGVGDVLKYVVGLAGAGALILTAAAAMLGVSRVGYGLATNRQIPSFVGRLSPRFGSPWIVIGAAALGAAGLVIPRDLGLLVGIYAFGALVAFTIAHLSVLRMRFREPERDGRAYLIPWSVQVRGAALPISALIGLLASVAGWLALVIFHQGARYVGVGWLLLGVVLYVAYRKSQGKPLLRRVTITEEALRRHEEDATEFGVILCPIFGTGLDDDIIQTAARLAGDTHDDLTEKGAVIEAIWIFEIPMALPLDAPLPDPQLAVARAALAHARQVGEEYQNVRVATAVVRARRRGQAIVSEARRRGVEAIVLAADESSRVRGGTRLGARGPLDNSIGEITRYVVAKAPCRVFLTAPPSGAAAPPEPAAAVPGAASNGLPSTGEIHTI